jgi:ketosteroid isomerase-like protein
MQTGRLSLKCACVIVLVASAVVISQEASVAAASEMSEFHVFLEKVYEAQVELVQGRPEAFKALWSHSSDVTIFGGFGSGERGWDRVGPRQDWASAQFSEGSRSHEVLSTYVSGNLGYVVQLERIRFKVPGRSEESLLELRSTMIMRREPEGWRIVHRHADSQMTRRGSQ